MVPKYLSVVVPPNQLNAVLSSKPNTLAFHHDYTIEPVSYAYGNSLSLSLLLLLGGISLLKRVSRDNVTIAKNNGQR